ncbi:indigoidine synthase IndC [Vogesella oryzae]|uniref:indigoidine synthase IndC n=1 Tax=Vogesella oryzae TaxID=1735285 RepID=UPI0015838356|nr:indigoidine synthase IndC [Vogesella oryzae]
MPHVVIHYFDTALPAAARERIQQSLVQLLQQELSCRAGAVSIDLQPVTPAQWQQQVYQPLIEPRITALLRQPDYRY